MERNASLAVCCPTFQANFPETAEYIAGSCTSWRLHMESWRQNWRQRAKPGQLKIGAALAQEYVPHMRLVQTTDGPPGGVHTSNKGAAANMLAQ